ncbi:secreted/surface protein [Idiomarina sp. A28L]|uniref:fasciclin domain-containing protein n=1 Tax=Idiomarina sp. A28L TaxID=1036674 RepID=UPI0002138CAA|nr:secreted/surface protein [Idiomarina sp. A28L]
MIKLTTIAMSIALAGSFAVSGLTIADHHGGNKERSGYSMQDKAEKKGTIAEIAANNGSFGTLVAALDAADLVDVLNGEGPFTVFAPTDEAFAALPAGTVESLLEPANRDQLIAILTYHVVSGKVMSADLAGQQLNADTVEGSSLNIDATGYGVKVNDASVVTADIEADNGVIHVIDKVLIPSA